MKIRETGTEPRKVIIDQKIKCLEFVYLNFLTRLCLVLLVVSFDDPKSHHVSFRSEGGI